MYYHIGGMPELLNAVVVEGFDQLEASFARVSASEDPVADLMAMAILFRGLAQRNPHLFDLMFGLSTRGSYRHLKAPSRGAQSQAFGRAFAHTVRASARLATSGRIRAGHDPELVAAQLWSVAHGFITLELSNNFAVFGDPLTQILLPVTVNGLTGMGDDTQRAHDSGKAGMRRAGAVDLAATVP